MSHSTTATTNEVIIITTSSVRGDEPTLEIQLPGARRPDDDEPVTDSWTADDEPAGRDSPLGR
jgi:hypothetical protein